MGIGARVTSSRFTEPQTTTRGPWTTTRQRLVGAATAAAVLRWPGETATVIKTGWEMPPSQYLPVLGATALAAIGGKTVVYNRLGRRPGHNRAGHRRWWMFWARYPVMVRAVTGPKTLLVENHRAQPYELEIDGLVVPAKRGGEVQAVLERMCPEETNLKIRWVGFRVVRGRGVNKAKVWLRGAHLGRALTRNSPAKKKPQTRRPKSS